MTATAARRGCDGDTRYNYNNDGGGGKKGVTVMTTV